MTSRVPIPAEEKRDAFERVVKSRTFSRSEQLRAFLRYVCEADFEGRAHELNEYALGVFALGRPADYSPAEDSCVRSRAHELRHKLKTYYETEAPEDPLRIEIDKGAYVPRFARTQQATLGGTTASGELPLAPELRTFWASFLDADVPLLIVFDIRVFFHAEPTGLVVRDYQTNDPADIEQSAPLTALRERMGVEHFREVRDYADFGAVHAAFLLGRLLGGLGRRVGLKHSASLDVQDLWNSNVVVLGKPHLNPVLRAFLDDRDFVVNEYGTICNVRPLPGEAERYSSARTHGEGEKYALITRVPGPQPNRHLLLLSGPGAELLWALAESVTSPDHLREILGHLGSAPGELPSSFQVIVRATFQSNVPVKIRYVTHHVQPG